MIAVVRAWQFVNVPLTQSNGRGEGQVQRASSKAELTLLLLPLVRPVLAPASPRALCPPAMGLSDSRLQLPCSSSCCISSRSTLQIARRPSSTVCPPVPSALHSSSHSSSQSASMADPLTLSSSTNQASHSSSHPLCAFSSLTTSPTLTTLNSLEPSKEARDEVR